ncbi:hypothetical protein A0257_13730 [Hymenobacter psoromatis]|nr:hypothetical protein A0257_13730 [Hymenobacter psoromatis]
MLRRLLLPLLGLALLSTEAASAQVASVASSKPGSYPRAERRAGRTLTAREKRAAEAAAKAAAVAAAIPAQPPVAAASTWSGWSNEPAPAIIEVGNGQHRPVTNVSVAPGMPINQVGHGVSTDYNGRPLYRTTTAGTTLAPGR